MCVRVCEQLCLQSKMKDPQTSAAVVGDSDGDGDGDGDGDEDGDGRRRWAIRRCEDRYMS